MDLGSNIQKYRKEAGLTQKELAEILNVAVGTIQQYELGKRQPRLEMINRIAGALGVGIRRLYPDFQIDDWKTNTSGKTEAVKRVEELTEIPRYTQKEE